MSPSKRITQKEMDAIHRDMWKRERKLWLAEHPGRTSAEYTKLSNTMGGPDSEQNELLKWRRARSEARYAAMYQAWLDEHPGEDPLPEHLCALDNPFPGQKRWCAKAARWIREYERRTGTTLS